MPRGKDHKQVIVDSSTKPENAHAPHVHTNMTTRLLNPLKEKARGRKVKARNLLRTQVQGEGGQKPVKVVLPAHATVQARRPEEHLHRERRIDPSVGST